MPLKIFTKRNAPPPTPLNPPAFSHSTPQETAFTLVNSPSTASFDFDQTSKHESSNNSPSSSLHNPSRPTQLKKINSLKLKLSKRHASPTSPPLQPTPELPPLEIEQHYQDLTNLFDFQMSKELPALNTSHVQSVMPTYDRMHRPPSESSFSPVSQNNSTFSTTTSSSSSTRPVSTDKFPKTRSVFSKKSPTTLVEPSFEPFVDALTFTNKKPTPHFPEIEKGPTYKAQLVPTRNNSKSSSYKSSSVNAGDAENFLLHSETLDFLPNLRPAIDSVGSRLRSAGVPSSANLVMTKSQYDKLMQSKEEPREDDEDEDSDDEHATRARRVLEEDEAKKQDYRMRMKQDAHLSVYRQKMTKLTGSQIGLVKGTPFLEDPDDSEEDYDDVPLGILKAHGFPNHGRLKTMRSQPNLVNKPEDTPLQPPALQYRGDDMSIRSFHSCGLPTPPVVPEEGYLAMRNKSSTNLPGFNASVPMNRGLVGEIAKEEDAKLRRKSVLLPQPTTTDPKESELQTQLQQMMEMQSRILHQMSNSATLPTPGSMSPQKTRSSFDVVNQLSRGVASIRSAANSDSSLPRLNRPSHISHNSVGSYNDFLETRNSAFKFPHPPPQPTVKAVHKHENDEYCSDDEEENEAGWKEMEEQRQRLRQLWNRVL